MAGPFQEIEALKYRIDRALVSNPAQDDAEFLPHDMVRVFANASEVKQALWAVGLREQNLVNFVLRCAQRIFLILVMATEKEEKLSHLKSFQENNLDDRSLPLKFERQRNTRIRYTIPNGRPSQRLGLSLQTHNDTDLFSKRQWIFTSPVFQGDFHSEFHIETTLPYLSEKQHEGDGFFGLVSQVAIHPAHVPELRLKPHATSVKVALKRIRDDVAKEHYDLVLKERGNLDVLKSRGYRSPHLIKPIASYKHNGGRYLIFPWAEGGTLLSYRDSFGGMPAQEADVRWIIVQFAGLFGALEELHASNCRHGDLKPDNILWFKTGRRGGYLQIADLGLATFHKALNNTDVRKRNNMRTMTPSGNLRYSPPETGEDGHFKDARSRLYDMWSMGCVLLEMLVWLVYGPDGAKRFQDEELTPRFWERRPQDQQVQVRDAVNVCITCLEEQLRDCDALRDILKLVRRRLLVTAVEHRATARDARQAMVEIRKKCEHSGYRVSFPWRVRFPIKPNGRREQVEGITGKVHVASESYSPESSRTHLSVVSNRQEYPFRPSNLDDVWISSPDNEFAARLFQSLAWGQVRPRLNQARSVLCSKCSGVKAVPLFDEECDLSTLEDDCGLCGLLLESLKHTDAVTGKVVRLRQNATVIGIEGGPDLISLYSEPGPNIPDDCQIGLPQLLGQASQDQFTLLKAWIQNCDSTHAGCCRREYPLEGFSMPTRLIEVGEHVRLVLSASIRTSKYVALSHCWGRLEESQKFCAYGNNIEQLMTSIDLDHMPRTFMDAITVTRGLGLKYLWIDSLCIIQDDHKDWENEAGKMEQVFSAAYCTIGASSAKSSLDGFLNSRSPRPCVQIQTENRGTFYACLAIDNFRRDVELGELNKRGWVLQERALSRRTIYYTSSQVYWECGSGVHCETLGRLYNSKAAFLGDANFPASALAYYRDGRQLLIQDLYERYSSLAFTKPSDRSVAILGLQKRLARALGTQAAYGLFESYFGRGLLWKRGQEQDLTLITQPTGEQSPSWSWFSKAGVIAHLDLEFREIQWDTGDYENPFKTQMSTHSARSLGPNDSMVSSGLMGLAKRINMTQHELENHITFDREKEHEIDELRCVVIGRDKAPEIEMEDRMAHVLIILRSRSRQAEGVYERVGVGSLKSSLIASQGSWVGIW